MPDHAIEKDVLKIIEEINLVLQKHLAGPLPQISTNEKKLNLVILPIEFEED